MGNRQILESKEDELARMINQNNPKMVIFGVTDTGETFRPSDWAERMSGSLSTFQNNRIQYSPLLYPSMVEGVRCVVIDLGLKEANPELYRYIIEFAKMNRLKMMQQDPILPKAK